MTVTLVLYVVLLALGILITIFQTNLPLLVTGIYFVGWSVVGSVFEMRRIKRVRKSPPRAEIRSSEGTVKAPTAVDGDHGQ